MEQKKLHRRQAQQKSRMRVRLKAINALGGSCCQCGVDDYRVLEFDHVEPIQWRTNGKTKMNGQHNTNTINKMVKAGEDPNKIYQLLCANCHKIKTSDNQDYEVKRREDGTQQ